MKEEKETKALTKDEVIVLAESSFVRGIELIEYARSLK